MAATEAKPIEAIPALIITEPESVTVAGLVDVAVGPVAEALVAVSVTMTAVSSAMALVWMLLFCCLLEIAV